MRDELIRKYGAETVRSGGLKVYTTIDRRMQRAANRAVTRQLYYDDDPASAVVAIDPRSGAIKTMTAVTPGPNREPVQPRRAGASPGGLDLQDLRPRRGGLRGHQPGHDELRLGAAPLPARTRTRSRGRSPPTRTPTWARRRSRTRRSPRTTPSSRGSRSTSAPEKVAAMANRLGVASSLKTKEGAYVPSLGLGSIGVSPLDMASAYATIAAGGIYSKPMAIRKVVLAPTRRRHRGRGRRAGASRSASRVIADWVAAEVTRILEMNIQSGTGVGANIGRTAGGKTGTTENHADAWFCGITPTLSATVWVGYPQAEIPMTSVHGISVAGGTFPATIWRLFMEEAIGSTPERDFPEAQSEPIWHSFTPRPLRAARSEPPTYYYTPPASDDARPRSRRRGRRHRPRRRPSRRRRRPAEPLPPPPPPEPPPPPPPPVSRATATAATSLRSGRGDARRARHGARSARLPARVRGSRRRASSGPSATATSTSTASTRTGSSAASCRTGTSSSSTRPERSRSSCRRRCFPAGAYNFAFKSAHGALRDRRALRGRADPGDASACEDAGSTPRPRSSRSRRSRSGPISLNTYDLLPAALTVGALAAILRRRELLGFGLLGLAVTAKLYPLVLVPPALAFVWTTVGRRRAALVGRGAGRCRRCSSSCSPSP